MIVLLFKIHRLFKINNESFYIHFNIIYTFTFPFMYIP